MEGPWEESNIKIREVREKEGIVKIQLKDEGLSPTVWVKTDRFKTDSFVSHSSKL